ncbi:MAG: outer membrane protein transport protein [Proteobacteria bacterium]|nr:outer membrane protein transport protein [Pseudomonadota bacterium]
MFPSHLRIKLVSIAVASALSAVPLASQASGFALIEQSASGLGNAYSGAAAAAEDASTVYFNPAGMSLLPAGKQFSVVGHYIIPSAKFSNGSSVNASLVPTGSFSGDPGVSAFVPNAYFAMDLGPKWNLGIGLGAPFGLSTKYDSSWGGRFQAIESKIETINVNPAVSYKVNESTSLGFGVNYQSIDATLTSNANYAGAQFNGVLAAGGTRAQAAASAGALATKEGLVTLKGKDNAWGWNIGAMFKLAPATQLGVAYRSRISYTATGTVQFDSVPTAALAAGLPNGNIKLDLTVPDNLSFALNHKLDDKWQILGDATWTGWSVLKKFEVTRTNNIPATGATLNNIPYNWKDTWRAGVGANYKMNDSWLLKMGVAYDQTPTNNNDRGPRLPDGDRTWLSLGAKFSMSKTSVIDFGYAHLFVANVPINQNAGGNATNSTAAFGLINGNYSGSVDILSASYTHLF